MFHRNRYQGLRYRRKNPTSE